MYACPLRVMVICLGLGSICWTDGTEEGAPLSIVWVGSYYEGYSRARQEGRPLFLFFDACWSGPCRRLEGEVLRDSEVVKVLNQYVCVRIDVDADYLSPGRFGVHRVPVVLLLDRDEKPLLDSDSPELTPVALVNALERGLEEFNRRP